jgi:hypothetical protein
MMRLLLEHIKWHSIVANKTMCYIESAQPMMMRSHELEEAICRRPYATYLYTDTLRVASTPSPHASHHHVHRIQATNTCSHDRLEEIERGIQMDLAVGVSATETGTHARGAGVRVGAGWRGHADGDGHGRRWLPDRDGSPDGEGVQGRSRGPHGGQMVQVAAAEHARGWGCGWRPASGRHGAVRLGWRRTNQGCRCQDAARAGGRGRVGRR